MPFYDGAEEGPFMLQLRKWNQLPFQLTPSEFVEAFISPSKEILLLLSHNCEALLLPLKGKRTLDSSADRSFANRQNFEGLPKLHSLTSISERHGKTYGVGSLPISSSDAAPTEISSGGSELLQCPIICDVKSLAWGHFGDSYYQHEAFRFREILVVSSDGDIVVHLFGCAEKNTDIKSASESEIVQGNWVEWGPCGRKLVDLSSPDSSGPVYSKEVDAIGVVDRNSHYDNLAPDISLHDRGFMSKKWLRSFFIEPKVFRSESEYLLHVPPKSQFPSSVEVVSFSIFNFTKIFMEYFYHNESLPNTKHQLGETIYGGSPSHSEEHSPQRHVRPIFSTKNSSSSTGSYGSDGEISCKCSKVFGGSSHRFIGLVFTCLGSVSDVGENQANSKIFVIVVIVYPWGIQWLCCMNLECLNRDQGFQHEWVDFQFSDNFLVCLNSSGLVCIRDAKVGDSVVQIDALKSCGLYSAINDVDHLNFSRGDDPHPMVRDHGSTHENEVIERGKNALTHFYAKRRFRKLTIASSSMLLAAIDDLGIMYIICIEEYLPQKCKSPESVCCLPDVLSGWKVAGSGVGNRRAFSGAVDDCDLFLNESKSVNECWSKLARQMKGSQLIQGSENKFNTCSNGFALSSSSLISSSLRKVLMPITVQNKNDCICFSSLGLTRFVRDFSGSKHKIVHTFLHVSSVSEGDFVRDKQLQNYAFFKKEFTFSNDAVGSCFKGFLYLVTEEGLFIVIPTLLPSSDNPPAESFRFWQPSTACKASHEVEYVEQSSVRQYSSPWQTDIIDRVILYEGPEYAEAICFANGWDMKVVRVRRMQLALHYLKYEEIERSLEMLADVKLAEEGILRLIFASVYQITSLLGGDDGGALATRFLSLAASFATKMIRRYGLLEYEQDNGHDSDSNGIELSYLPQDVPNSKPHNLRKMKEMALFLEIIRNIQCRLGTRSGSNEAHDGDSLVVLDSKLSQDEPSPSSEATAVSPEASSAIISDAHDPENKLELLPVEHPVVGENGNADILKKSTSRENPKDMMTRWVVDNLDLRSVVRDALLADRLPLAVLQLHLQHLNELASGEDPRDTFSVVRNVGKTIAYNMFLEGETELATTTLQRLGENVEVSLRQLLFGTLRRSIRKETAEEMNKLGYLKSHELRTLERLSLIERSYPHSSFWDTYKKKHDEITPSIYSELNSSSIRFQVWDDFSIECGDADGAVLDPWANISDEFVMPEADADEDTNSCGYWVCAAVWSDAWNQCTIDRMVLDQHSFSEVSLPWESQLKYYILHNDWREVDRLLDDIQMTSLAQGFLKINIEQLHMNGDAIYNDNVLVNTNLICLSEELDPIFLEITNIRILELSDFANCSSWLKMLIEQKLAREFIFLKHYWSSTSEIVPILARSGFFFNSHTELLETPSHSMDMHLSRALIDSQQDILAAFHKLAICYCVQYQLPILMELYLDHHKVALDLNSLSSLQEVAGDCQWANWLLLTRVKGCEYDASFSNARCIFSKNMIRGGNLSVVETDEILLSVDDMAEGGGELAALATLMYAPIPIQKCLCKGSVSRHADASFQCTLENLKHGLQRFPTMWNTLVASSFGQDTYSYLSNLGSHNAFVRSASSDYLVWRDTIFSSVGGDTSLIQMLPCWFSKSLRRLIKIFVQGPPGWQSMSGLVSPGESFLHRRAGLHGPDGSSGFNAVSWEVAIQRSIEKLYSSVQEKTLGIEHHLHRGRALAAFNLLLGSRTRDMKSQHSYQVTSGGPILGQTNYQSDIHTLLGPLTQTERSQLSSVMPLAIMHFEDSVLVASCAFLLELCGVSANMLRLDVAVLERISSYYKSSEPSSPFGNVSPKASRFNSMPTENFIISLARALADDCLHHAFMGQNDASKIGAQKFPLLNLRNVLQHLEKASLPSLVDGNTCGSWLSSGIGDGIELRSQQKAASNYWHLVTLFCQMHNLPISTKYLAALARDNDWVGFLAEAQITGFPIESIIKVADKDFSDPRLKMHILTILKGIQSIRKQTVSKGSEPIGLADEKHFTGSNDMNPAELFGLVSECERKKNPGEALLLKAKNLRWSLLALVASCFQDVSSLSCLTVWLEISVARETSSIKINDIYSKIASKVGAAVEATNALPLCNRAIRFHYNRKNPKRRRRPDDLVGDTTKCGSLDDASGPELAGMCFIADVTGESGETVEGPTLTTNFSDSEERLANLSNMISVLSEQHLFLPLLRAFELFLPSSPILPFIRSLQAFSQMRLSEASAHLAIFSSRNRELSSHINSNKKDHINANWISSTSVKAANAVLSTCPSAYEKRCLLLLLSSVDFRDGGSAASYFQRLYWKINLAEPLFRKGGDLPSGAENLDDASLLEALEKSGQWEQARTWANQLDSSDAPWKPSSHHVIEMQAEAMVAEWKEFLWDVPEERAAIWGHCQTLFVRHSFPPLEAGKFFLKHAETIEKDIPSRELHELLLLSLQWLSGFISQCNPVFPLHLLRDIETSVWLLAVESEAQCETERDFTSLGSPQSSTSGNSTSIIEQTANIISKIDNHMNSMLVRSGGRNGTKETNQMHIRSLVSESSTTSSAGMRAKRRSKAYPPQKRSSVNIADNNSDNEDSFGLPQSYKNVGEVLKSLQAQDENDKADTAFFGWDERIQPAQLEKAILSLLEFGQIQAARQLQRKLSPTTIPSELVIIDSALRLASVSSGSGSEIFLSMLDPDVRSLINSYNPANSNPIDQVQMLELLALKCSEGCGRGLCKRIIAVLKASQSICIPFSEAFEKRPTELLQLLSLKAQECLDEARLLVQSHKMPPASVACILAESFLKGLLAAHRGGYMDSQKDEGPAPLLWRFSDFLKWAELCSSEPEIGHALTRLVMTSQEIPHACEVELLILAHHFYKSSSCLGGVDVLVTLAANRVESYVLEGDFSCLARLVTGVGNFHSLSFILSILIENGQLELLLQKYSSSEVVSDRTETVRGFRMAVLTALKQIDPHDLDAVAMVCNHFDMKHETASLLVSRSEISLRKWNQRRNKDQVNEDLLESMEYLIEAAEVYSTIDAGQKTHKACAQACLVSLQVRIPDFSWLNHSETNSRRLLSEQSRFQEALIVAEAYGLNKPSEWAPVLWNLMLRSDLIEQFIAEFVIVLPLQPSMLTELARYYRSEVAARGERSHFAWLTSGGMSSEWVKHLAKSFRSLLKKTRDLRVRMQLATIATGFGDVINSCAKVLDKVPDNSGPLILRRGHGGAYLPLM